MKKQSVFTMVITWKISKVNSASRHGAIFQKIYLDVFKKLSTSYYKIGNFLRALNFCHSVINNNPFTEGFTVS